MYISVVRIMIVLILIYSSAGMAFEVVVNGSFEFAETLPVGIPSDIGYWGGDICAVLDTDSYVIPFDGTKMVKFLNTTAVGPSMSSVESQLFQFIDLQGYQAMIETGAASVVASFYINRYDMIDIDTEFRIGIDAFAGSPANYPNTNYISRIDSVLVMFDSDSDISTWEMISAELQVPPGTEYICIIISARENNENDGTNPEFDGHFADNVSVDLRIPVAVDESTWGRIKLLGN